MKNILSGVLFFVLITSVMSVDAVEVTGVAKNHEFEKIQINYRTGDPCSFEFSPVSFCDDHHLSEIKKAIETMRPNFDQHYILLSIVERKEYFQRSLIIVDADTGIAYPFPFDAYSGPVDRKGNVHGYGKVSYDLNSNRVCIAGSIVAYRETDNGKLCWKFDNGKFIGHRTPYTDE